MSVPRHTSAAIDMTRGIAALGVIWGHAIYMMDAPLALNGAFWVWVFLPLSGYLVARSFDPGGYARTLRGSVHFLWNRALRLLPLAEAALLCGLMIAMIGGVELPAQAYKQFVFVPPLNNMSLVGPLWTVAAELQFYVVAILLVPFTRLVWRYGGLVAASVLWIAAIYGGQLWISAVGDSPPQPRTMVGNAAFFVFGVVLAQGARPLMRIPSWLKVGCIIACVATAWYLENYQAEYFWGWGTHTTWPFGGAALAAFVLTALVLLTDTPPVKPGVCARVGAAMEWCGFYTYGIYVAHSVLATANSHIWHVKPGFTRLAILLCAVPIAPLTYKYYERHWLRLKVDRPPRERPSLASSTIEVAHGR